MIYSTSCEDQEFSEVRDETQQTDRIRSLEADSGKEGDDISERFPHISSPIQFTNRTWEGCRAKEREVQD